MNRELVTGARVRTLVQREVVRLFDRCAQAIGRCGGGPRTGWSRTGWGPRKRSRLAGANHLLVLGPPPQRLRRGGDQSSRVATRVAIAAASFSRTSGSSQPAAAACPPPPSARARCERSTVQSGDRRRLSERLFAS